MEDLKKLKELNEMKNDIDIISKLINKLELRVKLYELSKDDDIESIIKEENKEIRRQATKEYYLKNKDRISKYYRDKYRSENQTEPRKRGRPPKIINI